MMPSSRSDRQQQMYAHIKSWQQGSLAKKKYYSQYDVNIHIFPYWRTKYRSESTTNEWFVPVITDD